MAETVAAAKANPASVTLSKGIALMQLAAALLVAFALVLFLTPHGAAVSPDSIFYLDIATHIHAGDGVKSIDYTLAQVGTHGAVANTTWPPLYPALLALNPAPPTVQSAALLSALLLAATLFCTQRILGRLLSWPLATGAGLALAVVVPVLTIHVYAWSEQLFAAILTGLLWAVLAYLTDAATDTQRRRQLLLIALLLVLAFYTRYIGILFFVLLPLLYLLDRRPRVLLSTYLGCGLFCAAAAIALLVYNMQVGGHLTGTARVASQAGVLEQLRSLVSALVPVFLVPGAIGAIGLCALFAMAAAFYLLSARPAAERRVLSITTGLALGGAAYYLMAIVLLRSFVAFDTIDVRLIGVVAPYAWIGCVALIAGYGKRVRQAAPALIAAGVAAALLASGFLTVLATRQSWLAHGSPWLRINAAGAYNNYNLPAAFNQNRRFLEPLTGPDSILVVDEPQVLRYTTGLASFFLPKDYSTAEMQKLATAPARSYLIISPGQRQEVEAQLLQHGAQLPQVTTAGDTVLLHLPLRLNGAY